jgi:hypothetical protein
VRRSGIVVKPDRCAPTVEIRVQKPDTTCETVRADLSDRLSAVLQRCHPGGNFVLPLEGEPKPLDLDLQVGEIGICSNDKLIVALAPPPVMVPFTFALNGNEMTIESSSDLDLETAVQRTGWQLPEPRAYLHASTHFMDGPAHLGSVTETPRIEILEGLQRFCFHGSSGSTWRLMCKANSTCQEAINLLNHHKPCGLSRTRLALFLDKELQNPIPMEAVLFLKQGTPSRSLDFYCQVSRPYRFRICYHGDQPETTRWFADDETVGSCKQSFEREFGCEVRLSRSGTELKIDNLVIDWGDDVLVCEKLDPEYSFRLPDGRIVKDSLLSSTKQCDVMRLFDAFEYGFFSPLRTDRRRS